MVYPTKYSRQFDFASYQNANPTRPLPGDRVNVDLNAVKQSVTEIVDFLKGPIRSDGQLMNGTVGRNQLADNNFLGFDAPTDWSANTIYTTSSTVFHGNIFYKANVNHTSGDSFDASKWDVIADFSAAVTAAAASADAAAASAASIVGDADAAATSAAAAATSETNAATSETNAAASAASIPDKDIDSLAAAAAMTIAASVNAVTVMGYTDPGDAPPAPYVSRLSEPSHSGKFLSNGVWRELAADNRTSFLDAVVDHVSQRRGVVGSVRNVASRRNSVDAAEVLKIHAVVALDCLQPAVTGDSYLCRAGRLRNHLNLSRAGGASWTASLIELSRLWDRSDAPRRCRGYSSVWLASTPRCQPHGKNQSHRLRQSPLTS